MRTYGGRRWPIARGLAADGWGNVDGWCPWASPLSRAEFRARCFATLPRMDVVTSMVVSRAPVRTARTARARVILSNEYAAAGQARLTTSREIRSAHRPHGPDPDPIDLRRPAAGRADQSSDLRGPNWTRGGQGATVLVGGLLAELLDSASAAIAAAGVVGTIGCVVTGYIGHQCGEATMVEVVT